MGKIHRHKDESGTEHHIDLDSGNLIQPTTEAWSTSLSNSFVKCCSLVEQIEADKINLVDETNLNTIACAMVPFGDKGKSLLTQICLYQTIFSTGDIEQTWVTALRISKSKNANYFIRICKAKGLEAKTNEEVWEYKIKDPGKPIYTITDEMSEDEVEELKNWNFIQKNNCYYFARYDFTSGICTLERRSNFILNILFHITRGKQNKRVIELVNVHGRKVTTDIETKQLTGFQAFREFTEGAGNFIFEGTTIDLLKIKNKLFEMEKPSQQIDMLGWNKQGKFFAFSNGLYNSQFHEVDQHGIVTLNDKNYFIPYHPRTDEYTSVNEKLFSFTPRWPDHNPKLDSELFDSWATLYCQAFGDTGRVALLFGIATLFSDHIFSVRRNFPMLFLYGEGGSGKSRVGAYLQFLWGEPQPPLKLSDRANTDKARIRKMAQYINAMALFEEFINELEMNIIKTITGVYDRFGYERSNMNSLYGTETVPINSTAFITGNSYPNDDPLMQRIILIDYNKNVRDSETVEAFNKLTAINRKGLTTVTGWLLQFRQYFLDHYENEFDLRFAEFKALCAAKQIIVPDRMCENYALILTTYAVISKAGIKLPFMPGELKTFMLSTIKAQADKRDVGSVTQRFWDILQLLASEGSIRSEKEFSFNGNTLSIRWTEIHGMYMEKHQRLHRSPGLGKSTMLQKLRDSGFMITDGGDKKRFDGKVCHSYTFEYDKLGIDLMSVVEYWQAQDRRYARKEDQQAAENVTKVTKVTNEAKYSQNTEKPIFDGENDDLPF